jgi:hypothetical protein
MTASCVLLQIFGEKNIKSRSVVAKSHDHRTGGFASFLRRVFPNFTLSSIQPKFPNLKHQPSIMASHLIDITGGNSGVSPSTENLPSKTKVPYPGTSFPQPAREYLRAVANGALLQAEVAPKTTVSDALNKAIDTLILETLRMYMKQICETNTELRSGLEAILLA